MPSAALRWSTVSFARSVRFTLIFLALALPGAAFGADFPPVTDAERALTSVPGTANAPAVVLFHKGEFQMLNPANHEVSSRLSVQERIKILTEEGKSQGEVEIEHSEYVRLSGFAGRTILPDGTVVPLPGDAKFVRRVSKNHDLYVTAVAFPAVAVGAILDFHYDLHFDSIFFIEPWYFAGPLPTLQSEIVYYIPKSMSVQTWSRDPLGVGIKSERTDTVRGTRARNWVEHVAAVPQEPFGFPFEDMTAQITMLPTVFHAYGDERRLLETWASTSDLLLDDYDKVLNSDRKASHKAEELAKAAGAAGKGKREQAAAIYRFVRDGIVTEGAGHAFLNSEHSVDSTLSKGRGDALDKALLLVAMLNAVKIKASPVWAAERAHGLVDLRLANPAWFDENVVAAEIDGKRIFLDPADRALGFGQLPYELEGTIAVIPDRKKPESVALPEAPFDHNGRHAVLKLAVDPKGALAGTGTLLLTGQHATLRIGWKEDAEKTATAWKQWLEKGLKDFTVTDVQVTESTEDPKVEVHWKMAQRSEEALGDEVSVLPSRPLGPTSQPFALPSAQRRSPVLFDFADRDEVELELTWPAGWKVERRPQPVTQESDAGALKTELEVKDAERSLTYHRRLDVTKKQIITLQGVDRMRALFSAVEKSDAESLVLVRR
jgi:hypothetical protein